MIPFLRRSALTLALVCAAPAIAQNAPGGEAGAQDAPPAADQPAAPDVAPDAPSAADAAFTAFVQGLRARAIAEGVKPETFDRETAGLTFNSRVIHFDRSQPGGAVTSGQPGPMDFAPYRRSHVDQAHIEKGQTRYQMLSAQLAGNQARMGVPGNVALAIFGLETGYGIYTGSFDLIRSFASLAYDGRRRELFTAELIATLKLIDQGFTRAEMKGSWAGATGYPQFLPSTYLRIGTDGDGDGKADIWTNDADTLASIAAYLREAGWKPNTPWGVAATLPSDFDRAAIRTTLVSPRCPRVHARLSRWLTIGEWKAKGVIVAGYPAPADTELATLLEPDGPGMTAYLLTTNYRAILDYNCSNFYAMSVGVLADAIVR
ncbi:lytic murein transglycosylase [Sphingomonas sp.]|uniref:lytic murein transglycosylase n=1 Tax=Sphingomonas sp. TaxID=28214 RepID=UPI002D1FBA75|nr:lytic murein transglycosylase [Sphingomonas sp.]